MYESRNSIGVASCNQDARPSLNYALTVLIERFAILTKVIDDCERRVDSVLVPNPPVASGPIENRPTLIELPAPKSPMHCEIDTLSLRVAHSIERLESLMRRIDL